MPEFLLCVLQYVIILVVLLLIGCIGAFIGVKIRKAKDAKKAKNEAVDIE